MVDFKQMTAPEEISDEMLMRLFQTSREPKLFELLYNRHFVSLSKYIYWLTNDLEQGKDIAQNIFLKLYDNPNLFDTSKNFKVWLFSIAKNRWKNHLRKKSTESKYREQVSSISFHNSEPNEEISKEVNIRKIKKAMKQLSDDHCEVIALKYISNFTINEIADILDSSQGTIKSRIFYGLNNLKKLLNHGNE